MAESWDTMFAKLPAEVVYLKQNEVLSGAKAGTFPLELMDLVCSIFHEDMMTLPIRIEEAKNIGSC